MFLAGIVIGCVAFVVVIVILKKSVPICRGSSGRQKSLKSHKFKIYQIM